MTFLDHIGQAILQPETSESQPISKPGVEDLSGDSITRIKGSVPVNPPSHKRPPQPIGTVLSNTQSDTSIAVMEGISSPSYLESLSSRPSNLNHDQSQATSSENVRVTESLEGTNQVATYMNPTIQAPGPDIKVSSFSRTPTTEPKANTSSYLDLPLEIRQHILSYIVDPQDTLLSNATLCLTYRPATTLSQVSHQVRMDTHYLHLQWQRKHDLQDLLCSVWTSEDQQMYNELKKMIGDQLKGRTRAHLDMKGAHQVYQLLRTLNTFRAQKMETKNLIDQLKTTVAMQREVNHELREENEKLVLALEMRDMELGSESSNTDA